MLNVLRKIIKLNSNNYLNFILSCFILLGVLIAIYNFFGFRSLWLDESSLALNIVPGNWCELLKPLKYNQVAPIGFLISEKIFSEIFDGTDWSLRVYPLISFLFCLPLLYFLAKKILNNVQLALFCVAFFSLSYQMIYFSSEVKQYMSDVTLAVFILLITLYFTENKKHYWLYSVLGALSIWFSNISIILLFTSGLYFLSNDYRNFKELITKKLVFLIPWLFSFLIYYIFFIHNHPTKPYMDRYWNYAFMPKNIFEGDFYKFIFDRIRMIFSYVEVKPPIIQIIFFLFFIVGTVFTKKKTIIFLLSPLIVHFLLSYFRLYPIGFRLTLYNFPIIIIFFSNGFYIVIRALVGSRNLKILLFLLLLPLILNFKVLYFRKGIRISKEEIKCSMHYVNKNISLKDNLIVYYSSRKPFIFYKPYFENVNSLKDDNVIFMQNHRDNWREYSKYITQVSLSKEVWLIISHPFQARNKIDDKLYSEEEYIVYLFNKYGFKTIEKQHCSFSSAYRFSCEK